MAKNEQIDGFCESVQLAEKLEPISILAKVNLQSSFNYIIGLLENIDLMLESSLNKPEQSQFWEPENIQKSSWVIVIASEMLKADQKVLHRRILQSKRKADILADTLSNLTIEEKSKIELISSICS